MGMELTNKEIERYSRQLILSSWSEEKQIALKHARILLDAKLTSAAYYLVAAGAENLCLFGKMAQSLHADLLELNPLLQLTFNTEIASNCDFAIGISTQDIRELQSATIGIHFEIQKTDPRSLVILKNGAKLLALSGRTESLLQLKAGALIAAAIFEELK